MTLLRMTLLPMTKHRAGRARSCGWLYGPGVENPCELRHGPV